MRVGSGERVEGLTGAPFNILIVLLTQWNEISWRNARAITQNHSSVRHAACPSPASPAKRPVAVGQSTVPRVSSNRPPTRREPLSGRAASGLSVEKGGGEDGERRMLEEEAVELPGAPSQRGASSAERTISSSRKGCYEFHSKSWLGQCSSGSRLRYVHTSYNQDVVQGIIFERYWSASKLSFGRL